MEALLTATDLLKRFGELVAVDGVGFSIQRGEALGLYGPNGSGKTTLFNMMSGLITADAGSVKFLGSEILGLKPHQIVKKGVARTFQLTRPFLNLSVLENVLAAHHGASQRNPAVQHDPFEILGLTGLSGYEYFSTSRLSPGYLRRLEVARALATGPKLLLLDEPFSVLSLKDQRELVLLLNDLCQRGLSMMVVTHSRQILRELCHRVLILSAGRKVWEGDPADVPVRL